MPVLVNAGASRSAAMPKSMTPASPGVSRMFAGLRSRCTTGHGGSPPVRRPRRPPAPRAVPRHRAVVVHGLLQRGPVDEARRQPRGLGVRVGVDHPATRGLRTSLAASTSRRKRARKDHVGGRTVPHELERRGTELRVRARYTTPMPPSPGGRPPRTQRRGADLRDGVGPPHANAPSQPTRASLPGASALARAAPPGSPAGLTDRAGLADRATAPAATSAGTRPAGPSGRRRCRRDRPRSRSARPRTRRTAAAGRDSRRPPARRSARRPPPGWAARSREPTAPLVGSARWPACQSVADSAVSSSRLKPPGDRSWTCTPAVVVAGGHVDAEPAVEVEAGGHVADHQVEHVEIGRTSLMLPAIPLGSPAGEVPVPRRPAAVVRVGGHRARRRVRRRPSTPRPRRGGRPRPAPARRPAGGS